MVISEMYVNPALVMMFLAMLTAFLLVGKLLWNLAHKLAAMDTKIDHLDNRMNSVEQTLKAKS
jgi:hypothetical protein